jgi:glucose-6-phosphate 1-dehydrogenase
MPSQARCAPSSDAPDRRGCETRRSAPSFVGTIAEQLSAAGLSRSSEGWRRLVIEKPFGQERVSAAEDFLNDAAGTWGPAAARELLERSGRRWSVGD